MKIMKKAFTLIELLVVISIVAILVSTITLSFANAQKKARDSRRMEDMNSIQKALEMYYGQNNYKYPDSLSTLVPGYVQAVRNDPKTNTPYTVSIGNTGYCICADVENKNEANSAGTGCTFSGVRDYYCVKNRQ